MLMLGTLDAAWDSTALGPALSTVSVTVAVTSSEIVAMTLRIYAAQLPHHVRYCAHKIN